MQSFDVAAGVVVCAADAMDHPARVHALRDGEPPRRLERFNDDLLATLKLGAHEDVRLQGAQGDEEQMWLVYPPGSAHRPTVRPGRALVLYLLPEGRIEFTRTKEAAQ